MGRLDQMSLQKIIIFTAHENDNTVAGDKTPVRNIDITLRTEAHNVETFGKSEKSQSLTLRFHRSPSESSKERKSRGSSPAINHSIKSSSAPIHCHTGLTQEMEALNLSPDSASHTLSGLNAMKSVSINVSHQEDNCGRLVHENRTTTKDVHGKCDHSSDMPLVLRPSRNPDERSPSIEEGVVTRDRFKSPLNVEKKLGVHWDKKRGTHVEECENINYSAERTEDFAD